ncbi:hypothetical protein T492DRAFT_225023 [Pavlovales sp. CCMP2436]|nr:hypothetical protein T492DRAFT_225023 [Pavlovales sp. CCMP2436]
MEASIKAAERGAAAAEREAAAAAEHARAARGEFSPLNPSARASELLSSPPTPVVAACVGIELLPQSWRTGSASAVRPSASTASATTAGGLMVLPAVRVTAPTLLGVPALCFRGTRAPPAIGRGASVPPSRTDAQQPGLLSPATKLDLSGRQLSQPAPPTTSRQVSHRPQATLRRGLSSFRSETKLRPLALRLRDPPMQDDEEIAMRQGFFRKDETRALRREYLQQSFWSNQFTGNPEVEDRFHRYVSEYQMERVQKRLWLTSVCLAATGVYVATQADISWGWAVLRMGVPSFFLFVASMLLRKPKADRLEDAETSMNYPL